MKFMNTRSSLTRIATPVLSAALLIAGGLIAGCGGNKAAAETAASEGTPGSTLVPTTTSAVPAAPSATPAPLVEAAPAKGEPGRTNPEIQARILERRAEAKQCYDAQKKLDPKLAPGQITVKFTIDETGKVTEAAVVPGETDIHVETVQNCVVQFIRSFQYPASPKGLESRVRYPFMFGQQASGTPQVKK